MYEYNGKHLLVDAVCGKREALVSADVGKACLDSIVERLGMTMVLPPVIVKFPHASGEMTRVLEGLEREGLGQSDTACSLRDDLRARQEQHFGYSCFVMIAESHMSIHTFPEVDFLTFDCFSCTGFDPEPALDELDRVFGFTDKAVQVIPRNQLTLGRTPRLIGS